MISINFRWVERAIYFGLIIGLIATILLDRITETPNKEINRPLVGVEIKKNQPEKGKVNLAPVKHTTNNVVTVPVKVPKSAVRESDGIDADAPKPSGTIVHDSELVVSGFPLNLGDFTIPASRDPIVISGILNESGDVSVVIKDVGGYARLGGELGMFVGAGYQLHNDSPLAEIGIRKNIGRTGKIEWELEGSMVVDVRERDTTVRVMARAFFPF